MKGKSKYISKGIYIILFSLLFGSLDISAHTIREAEAAESGITYTLKASDTPYMDRYIKSKSYNSYTKQYYLLRSYLEQLEKQGGGTLILSAGTYKICNVLYIPSHVTIILKDGVVLQKTKETGTPDLKGSGSMIQLAAPSKSKTAGVYSGYNGETDIHLIGEGNATIDLNYVKDSIGIIFGHNTEVSIRGITFCNMQGGHFIEMDASKAVTIENNVFQNHKPSVTGIKEAINIDTPDSKTGGFHATWTSYDCTPDMDVTIRGNTFRNLERAIGTHKYSEGKYHENISLLNNTIENTDSDAIRIINWKNAVITGNLITNVNGGAGTERAILASGLLHAIITENTFTMVPRPIQLMPWKNTNTGSEYAITYNEMSEQEIALMLKNYLVRTGEPFIRVNGTYNLYTSDTKKYYYSSTYIK